MMTCKSETEPVSALFTADACPVIGVNGRTVRFLNPAAQRLFGAVGPGAPLRRLLPEHVVMHQARAFYATARIAKQPYAVTLTSMPELKIYRLEPVRRDAPFPGLIVPGNLLSLELGLSAGFFSAYAAGQTDPVLRHHAARLEHASDQLRRWISNVELLQELRQDMPVAAPVALDIVSVIQTIAEHIRPVLARRGIRLEVTVPESPCPVHAAAKLIEALLLNLLSNAVKSAPSGSCVRVDLARGVRTVKLAVRDSGPGFPEHVLQEQFHAYSAHTLPTGTCRGYGLPVCFAAADALRGSILIEAPRGDGACVSLILPMLPAAKAVMHMPGPRSALPDMHTCRAGISDALTDEDYLPFDPS